MNVSFENTEIAFAAKSDKELRKLRRLFSLINRPFLVKTGTAFTLTAMKLGLPVNVLVIKTMYKHFCGGKTIDDCDDDIQKLADYGIGTILDYSVEGGKKEDDLDDIAREIIKTVEKASDNPDVPFSVFKLSGIAALPLLEKLNSKKPLTPDEEESYNRLEKRVDAVCKKAFEHGVKVLIDAEDFAVQDAIDAMAYAMMRKYNKKSAVVFNTFQFYRRDMLNNLKQVFDVSQKEKFFLGAKPVRGAYMEKERERARRLGYPDPIQPDKASTDRDFDAALDFCTDHIDHISLCAGTHNEASSLRLIELMKEKNIAPNDERVFFSQLYGMSDHISYNLAAAGYNVAKYVPYGPVRKVLPYLFRRAKENTAVKGQSSRELELIQKEIKRRRKK